MKIAVGKSGKLFHQLFALAFGVGEEFEFYYDKVLYYFYPQDRLKVIKWSVVWDMLQERIANEKDKERENASDVPYAVVGIADLLCIIPYSKPRKETVMK